MVAVFSSHYPCTVLDLHKDAFFAPKMGTSETISRGYHLVQFADCFTHAISDEFHSMLLDQKNFPASDVKWTDLLTLYTGTHNDHDWSCSIFTFRYYSC